MMKFFTALVLLSVVTSFVAGSLPEFWTITSTHLLNHHKQSAPSTHSVHVTGLTGTLQDIDIRPSTGVLYALTTLSNATGRLYAINTTTGVAKLSSAIHGCVFEVGTSPLHSIDFDPITENLRIIAAHNGADLEVDPIHGTCQFKGELFNALTFGPIHAGAVAFTNNIPGATHSTMCLSTGLKYARTLAHQIAVTHVVEQKSITGPAFDIYTTSDGSHNIGLGVHDHEIVEVNLVDGKLTHIGYINATEGAVVGLATIPHTAKPPAPCTGEVNVIGRGGEGSHWTHGNSTYRVYDVQVINKGTCNITHVAFGFHFGGAAHIIQSWNLQLETPKGYGSVHLYAPIHHGATYRGAGFIIANESTHTIHSGNPFLCACPPPAPAHHA